MGGRRISLVRRPTVTVLINQQAGTPTTPGTPKTLQYDGKRSDNILKNNCVYIPLESLV